MAEPAASSAYPATLPPAPRRLVESGAPVFGAWAGSVLDAGFAGLAGDYPRSAVDRRLVEKRWVYLLVPLREAMLALAIVDTGYLSSGICAVFDRESRRLLADSNPVLPPLLARISDAPADGLDARLAGPLVRARFQRSAGRILATAKWGNVDVDLALDADGAPPALSACCPLGPGRFNFTQKLIGLRGNGEIRVGNTRFPVAGESCGMDFTHGCLLRETRWKWAFATGTGRVAGFNFSEGFMQQGTGECAAWIDGAPVATGPVQFEHDPDRPLDLWHVRSADGSVDLTFRPEGQRAQDIDLKLIASRYVQPFGAFEGHVTSATGERVALRDLPGVVEDHEARW